MRIDPHFSDLGLGEQIDSRHLGGRQQALHQTLTRSLGHCVHPQRRVARVGKALQQLPRDAVTLAQGIERRCNGLGVGLRQMQQAQSPRKVPWSPSGVHRAQ